MVPFPYELRIPSQGLIQTFADAEEIDKFLRSESAFFSKQAAHLNANLVIANVNHGTVQILERVNRTFERLGRDIKSGTFDTFEQYVADAKALRILVAQSSLGREIARLFETSDSAAQQQARWMTYILCAAWTGGQADQILPAFRAAFAANPITNAYGDLVTAADALDRASKAAEASEDSKQQLQEFIRQKTEVFDHLEQLYRTKLTLDEPALTWQKIAENKTKAWGWWLGFFAVLVVLPVALSVYFWPTIAKNVHDLTVGTNGTFSLAGLATISVPALLYAWLLKNVSRIFIQNLNLADDAAHRRSLALTYMGLLQDDKHPASDQDRAIILNALFRPIPPQTADEGPPNGVLDLIRNK